MKVTANKIANHTEPDSGCSFSRDARSGSVILEDRKMTYSIEIQRHAKVADFIDHNDMIEKSDAEKQEAAGLYNTSVLKKSVNGMDIIYVFASKLSGEFIGGLVLVDEKVKSYTHSTAQHESVISQMEA